MNYRNYEFVLAGDKNNDQSTLEVDLYKIRSYSLQEALGKVFIHLHALRSKDEKTWRIVKATDTTHFDNVKML